MTTFQFLLVRLKGPSIASIQATFDRFQFLLVRLKAVE